jgi:ribonuclease BN (tRNA processing enzyme)
MNTVQVRFLGTGDAFGHGGRLQTCILIQTTKHRILIDFGASAMISLYRYGVNPNSIDLILLTHLHGDHFGGLPFFILDAQLISKRFHPLTVVGPIGSRERIMAAMEVMFPGSSKVKQKFDINIYELEAEQVWDSHGIKVVPYPVIHPSGDPSFALRVECDGRSIAYTGDTEWTEALIQSARGVDLLIAEAYFYKKQIKYHLNFKTLMDHMDELNPKRMIITHMSQDMLDMLEYIEVESADDGMIVEI